MPSFAAVAQTVPRGLAAFPRVRYAGGLLSGESLDAAILATIAYFDVFAFAPRGSEVHRFLIGCRATRPEVEHALERSPLLRRRIDRRGDAWFLAGKAHLAPRRVRFAHHSAALWTRAHRMADLVARTGLASAGLVTGSLALDNADEHADVDFLFVFPAERLWTSYAALRLLPRLPRAQLDKLCANYALSDACLEIRPQNLFTAFELAKAVPVFGFDVYRRMVRANAWVSRFLPNALPDPGPARDAEVDVSLGRRLFGMAPLRALEDLERRRKWAAERRDVGVDMAARKREGSSDRHSPTRSFHTLSELRYRLEQLGLEAQPFYREVADTTRALEAEMTRWGAEPLPAPAPVERDASSAA